MIGTVFRFKVLPSLNVAGICGPVQLCIPVELPFESPSCTVGPTLAYAA